MVMNIGSLKDEVLRLKNERDAVILAHKIGRAHV